MSTQIYAGIIIMLALIMLSMIPKLKKWNSWPTVIIFVVGFSAFVLRLALIQRISTNVIIQNTNIISALAYFIYTIVAVVGVVLKQSNGRQITKIQLKWWIVGGYFLFGFVQQVFFKLVVFDSLYALLGDGFFMRGVITILLSAFYYSLIHTGVEHIKDMTLLTFYIDIGWGLLYFAFGNLHWNIISHAIIGGALYSLVYEEVKDDLGDRFTSMQYVMEEVIEVKVTQRIRIVKDNLTRRLG